MKTPSVRIMEPATMVVALVFGALMGWGLSHTLPDPRPAALTFLVGMIIGAVIRIGELGATPEMAGGSLLLGCTAALAASVRSLVSG